MTLSSCPLLARRERGSHGGECGGICYVGHQCCHQCCLLFCVVVCSSSWIPEQSRATPVLLLLLLFLGLFLLERFFSLLGIDL
jgi:hypothetical protein